MVASGSVCVSCSVVAQCWRIGWWEYLWNITSFGTSRKVSGGHIEPRHQMLTDRMLSSGTHSQFRLLHCIRHSYDRALRDMIHQCSDVTARKLIKGLCQFAWHKRIHIALSLSGRESYLPARTNKANRGLAYGQLYGIDLCSPLRMTSHRKAAADVGAAFNAVHRIAHSALLFPHWRRGSFLVVDISCLGLWNGILWNGTGCCS